MTPIWVFPAYPLLLNGPMATVYLRTAINAGHLERINVVAVICCAVATQGTGWLISFMVSTAFLYRLMTQKLPRDSQRAGIFISLGPSAFTVTGVGKTAIRCCVQIWYADRPMPVQLGSPTFHLPSYRTTFWGSPDRQPSSES
jgi:tellurite resistance protein TehA-like permease